MDRGLYIAASGMLAEMVRQDQVANDLANANTPGYKPDRSAQRSFAEVLLVNSATGATVGPLGLGVQIEETVTDFAPGPLRETGEPLDFAVEGDGWFAVRTPDGVRYTRNGRFTVSARGTLTDALGNDVLSQSGRPITVGSDNQVAAAEVGLFALTGPEKVGESLVLGTGAERAGGDVRQGAIEGSATDPARAMVDMIVSLRAFEAGQRVISTIDDTLGKAANQVASKG